MEGEEFAVGGRAGDVGEGGGGAVREGGEEGGVVGAAGGVQVGHGVGVYGGPAGVGLVGAAGGAGELDGGWGGHFGGGCFVIGDLCGRVCDGWVGGLDWYLRGFLEAFILPWEASEGSGWSRI